MTLLLCVVTGCYFNWDLRVFCLLVWQSWVCRWWEWCLSIETLASESEDRRWLERIHWGDPCGRWSIGRPRTDRKILLKIEVALVRILKSSRTPMSATPKSPCDLATLNWLAAIDRNLSSSWCWIAHFHDRDSPHVHFIFFDPYPSHAAPLSYSRLAFLGKLVFGRGQDRSFQWWHTPWLASLPSVAP